jgi:hypothetical protein
MAKDRSSYRGYPLQRVLPPTQMEPKSFHTRSHKSLEWVKQRGVHELPASLILSGIVMLPIYQAARNGGLGLL